jgi:hypothetical protein
MDLCPVAALLLRPEKIRGGKQKCKVFSFGFDLMFVELRNIKRFLFKILYRVNTTHLSSDAYSFRRISIKKLLKSPDDGSIYSE